jgi:hypothetical protein
MKKFLSKVVESFAEIKEFPQKEIIDGNAFEVFHYGFDVGDEPFANRFIEPHQWYINNLFEMVDYIYGYYELGNIYFERLEYAVVHLERLSLAQIKDSPVEEAHKVKESLADYLDKAAMIFQTAADKTERETKTDTEFYQGVYNAKAREYSAKADSYRGILRFNYTEKMRDLYSKAAEKCKIDFIQVLLQRRADEYQEKYAAEIAARGASVFFGQKPTGVDDSESLLRHRAAPNSGNE